MSTKQFFPITLTNEERDAGFRLVHSNIPLESSKFVVAVLMLSPSARLIKIAGGYHLQYYYADKHPFMKNVPQTAAWNSVGTGPSSTIEHAKHRFHTEKLDPHFTLAIAPEDPTVALPDPQ